MNSSIRFVHINKLIRHFHLNIYLGTNGPTLLPEFWNIFKLRSMEQNWTTCSFVSLVNCWHHQKIYIFPGRSYLLYKDLTRDIMFNWGLQFVSLWFLSENQKSHSSNVIFGWLLISQTIYNYYGNTQLTSYIFELCSS